MVDRKVGTQHVDARPRERDVKIDHGLSSQEAIGHLPRVEQAVEALDPRLEDLWRTQLLGYQTQRWLCGVGVELAERGTGGVQRLDERLVVDAVAGHDEVDGLPLRDRVLLPVEDLGSDAVTIRIRRLQLLPGLAGFLGGRKDCIEVGADVVPQQLHGVVLVCGRECGYPRTQGKCYDAGDAGAKFYARRTWRQQARGEEDIGGRGNPLGKGRGDRPYYCAAVSTYLQDGDHSQAAPCPNETIPALRSLVSRPLLCWTTRSAPATLSSRASAWASMKPRLVEGNSCEKTTKASATPSALFLMGAAGESHCGDAGYRGTTDLPQVLGRRGPGRLSADEQRKFLEKEREKKSKKGMKRSTVKA
ncbi:hypothetical protein OPT61_g6007 [Boeremia exigua]|uniref:Uncharacterized protein n=1 Tax=Boeremia exigua TaxID=749465 RepID=A0ACC2I883_9PLEO|nr:hypothetical protein OPT61_g6007 [Boeremia exigua]